MNVLIYCVHNVFLATAEQAFQPLRRTLWLLARVLLLLAAERDGAIVWDRLEAEPPRPARYQRSPPGETWSFARVRLGNAGQGQEARPPRKREEEGNRTAGCGDSSVREAR